MSRYQTPLAQVDRLMDELAKYGKLIIAVDIDSTVLPFHQVEKDEDDYSVLHDLIRTAAELKWDIVMTTAAEQDRWDGMKQQLEDNDIPFTHFNETPDYIPNIGRNGHVYANLYLNDRGGLAETTLILMVMVNHAAMERLENASNLIVDILSDISDVVDNNHQAEDQPTLKTAMTSIFNILEDGRKKGAEFFGEEYETETDKAPVTELE